MRVLLPAVCAFFFGADLLASDSISKRLTSTRHAAELSVDPRYHEPALHGTPDELADILVSAVKSGHGSMARRAAESGANLTKVFREDGGKISIHFAAAHGELYFMDGILSLKKDKDKDFINIVDYAGRTALHIAAAEGHFVLVDRLVEEGAKVDAIDGNGDTPLTAAVAADRLVAAQRLLNWNANVEYRRRDGKTSLLIAASHGYQEIVRILLASKAKTDVRDSDGNTARELAKAYPLVEDLLSSTPKAPSPTIKNLAFGTKAKP